MKRLSLLFILLLGCGSAVHEAGIYAAPPLTGFPFADEALTYSVNWPTGLSLGSARFAARHATPETWAFSSEIGGSIPGIDVREKDDAEATNDLCSNSASKDLTRGPLHTGEKITIDRVKKIVTRRSMFSDGHSEYPATGCMKDALTYIYFLRRELGQGRVPQPQTIAYGARYQVSVQYAGAETIRIGDKPELSDKLVGTIKGPASENRVEVWFARDAARTPLMFVVPLKVGRFTLELVR